MNIIRLLLLTLIAVSICTISRAENIWDTGYRKVLVEDTARLKVIYVHIANDRIKNKQKVNYEMLSVGDKKMVYGGYGTYQLDSIYTNFTVMPSPEERLKIIRECEPIKESITIDPEKDTLNYYGNIFTNYYKYSEPIPKINWTLTDDTEEIMGYECHKATAKWRGSEWNAWYADIPINAGPWKFQGLPGLIMKVEDTESDHSIYAISLEKFSYPIGHTYAGYTKTTRDKYNEAEKDHAANAAKTFINSGMITLKSDEERKTIAKRRLFYAPLELE